MNRWPWPRPTRCDRICRGPRVPEPCAVVLFGATGRPDAPQARPGAVPPGAGGQPAHRVRHRRLRPPRLDRRARSARELEKSLSKEGDPEFDQLWPEFASHIVFAPGTFDDPAGYEHAQEAARGARQHARHARQPALLPGRRPRILLDDHRAPRQGRL